MKARKRTDTENAFLIDIPTAEERYQLSMATVRKLAVESGSLIKIGRNVRINKDKMDKYLSDLSGGKY